MSQHAEYDSQAILAAKNLADKAEALLDALQAQLAGHSDCTKEFGELDAAIREFRVEYIFRHGGSRQS